MLDDQRRFSRVVREARRFLARWGDGVTQQGLDELAHDSAVQYWLHQDRIRNDACHLGYLRTIVRRCRLRWLAIESRQPRISIYSEEANESVEALADTAPALCDIVDHQAGETLREELEAALATLQPLNRRLLESYYEGFSCAELADRYGMDAQCVKVRLHRSRATVRET